MSLDGAQLNVVNAAGVSVAYAAKGRKFNVGSYLGCDLVLPDAERVHCEIQCDAFGRVTIYNHSRTEPIMLNDQVVHATSKRPLLHGARIQILNDVYTWSFPKAEEQGTPDRAPPEPAANSSPTIKGHRVRRQFDNRLTVHNFRYSINSDDEGNTSIESRELETSAMSNSADTSDTEAPIGNSSTSPAKDADETLPKVDLLEGTQNKENTSTLGNKLMLELCARSDVVITSYSPRETGVKIEKSFTSVLHPSAGVVTTPKSTYNTPKSVLSELNDDSCSRDVLEFSTPSTSKKSVTGKRPTSMYLIDLTTPQRLRPTLSGTPKQTPVRSGTDSTDVSSNTSDIVIEVSSSTPSTTPGKQQQQRRVMKTPKEQLLAAGSTPKRTPQSLMKRALLTSAKKQILANSRTPTTPKDASNRQSLLDARRQCLTAPRRLPFHPQPQWRTPGRRQIPGLDVQAPQTSPRKRHSLSLSTPRDNKISKIRKTLAANAKISPNVGMSNKLVAKARRALNSPKQDSPKRVASPKADTPLQSFEPNQVSTPDRAGNPNAELSLTFTIDDENNTTGLALEELEKDAANESPKASQDSLKVDDESKPKSEDNDLELKASESVTAEESLEPLQDGQEDTLNRTYDLNVSQKDSIAELSTAEIEPLSSSKLSQESSVGVNTHSEADDEKPSEPEKNIENLSTEACNKSLGSPEADDIIEDSICEEVPTTNTVQEDLATTVHLAEDSICEEVPTNDEDTLLTYAQADSENQNEDEIVAAPGRTPIPRRSSRRLSQSNQQPEVNSSIRRSVRRASIDARIKLEQCIKPTRRASCSAVVETQPIAVALATPKRKRRLTEDFSTPTRKAQRVLCNTPKRLLQVDESVGDMGIIIEEDAPGAEKLPTVLDEDYGSELPEKNTNTDTDEPDKIDYHGMREMLKTPKSCSTPHFKGLREMVRTPKAHPSPMLGNIDELLQTPSAEASTPKRNVTVSRVSLKLNKSEITGDTQDMYFKTPRGKNLMIPNDPASAVLKSIDKSLGTTTEYDLNATNATLHLDKIFDDVLAVETTNAASAVDNSENEINVTAVSTATVSEHDPLSLTTTKSVEASDTVRSEILMSVGYADTSRKDPLTSTAFKKGNDTNFNVSYADEPKSPGICDVSGIQMLDRTTDSMFSEPLIVSRVDSFDVTLEDTKAKPIADLPRKSNNVDVLEYGSDSDSMVGLSEPLVLSDDDAAVEEANLESQDELSKSNAGDKTKLDNTEKSSISEKNLVAENSIDLTEEESEIKCTKDQKNNQDSEKAAEVSVDLFSNQEESQTDSEFAIELEASCITTAAEESVVETEQSIKSTIYGVELSRIDETLAPEPKPSDESSIDSVNIQNKFTSKEDCIMELDASNADTLSLDDENAAKKSTAKLPANDEKSKDEDTKQSSDNLPEKIEVIPTEEEAQSTAATTNQYQQPDRLAGTTDAELDTELNATNTVELSSKADDTSIIEDHDISEIEQNINEVEETSEPKAKESQLSEADTSQEAVESSQDESQDEALLSSTPTHDVIQIESQDEVESPAEETLNQEASMNEVEEKNEDSQAETSMNIDAPEPVSLPEQSPEQIETKSTTKIENESAGSTVTNVSDEKRVPEIIIISSEESSSESKDIKEDATIVLDSIEKIEEENSELSSPTVENQTNQDSILVDNESLVEFVEAESDKQETPSTSFENPSITPDNDDMNSVAVLETTDVDDSLVEVDADKSGNDQVAEIIPATADHSSDRDDIETETLENSESTNNNASLAATTEAEPKASCEKSPMEPNDDEMKSDDVLEAFNIDESLVVMEDDKSEDDQATEFISSAEISLDQNEIENKTQDDLETTNDNLSEALSSEAASETTSEKPTTEPKETKVEDFMETINIDESLDEVEKTEQEDVAEISTLSEIAPSPSEIENKSTTTEGSLAKPIVSASENTIEKSATETKLQDAEETINIDDSLVDEEKTEKENAAEILSTPVKISSSSNEIEKKTPTTVGSLAKPIEATPETICRKPSTEADESKAEDLMETINIDESLVEEEETEKENVSQILSTPAKIASSPNEIEMKSTAAAESLTKPIEAVPETTSGNNSPEPEETKIPDLMETINIDESLAEEEETAMEDASEILSTPAKSASSPNEIERKSTTAAESLTQSIEAVPETTSGNHSPEPEETKIPDLMETINIDESLVEEEEAEKEDAAEILSTPAKIPSSPNEIERKSTTAAESLTKPIEAVPETTCGNHSPEHDETKVPDLMETINIDESLVEEEDILKEDVAEFPSSPKESTAALGSLTEPIEATPKKEEISSSTCEEPSTSSHEEKVKEASNEDNSVMEADNNQTVEEDSAEIVLEAAETSSAQNEEEEIISPNLSTELDNNQRKSDAVLEVTRVDDSLIEKDQEKTEDGDDLLTLTSTVEALSNQDEIETEPEKEKSLSTTCEKPSTKSARQTPSQDFVETISIDDSLDGDSTEDEQAVIISSPSGEIPSSQDDIANKTQTGLESTSVEDSLTEMDTSEMKVIHINEQAAELLVEQAEAETDATTAVELAQTTSDVDNSASDKEIVKVNEELVEKPVESSTVTEISSISSDDKAIDQTGVETTNVDDSLVKLDEPVIAQHEDEPEIQSTAAVNAADNDVQLDEEFTTDNSRIEESCHELDQRKSDAEMSPTKNHDTQKENNVDCSDEKDTCNVSEIVLAEKDDTSMSTHMVKPSEGTDVSKNVSAVSEPAAENLEQGCVVESVLDASIDKVAETVATPEVETTSHNEPTLDVLAPVETVDESAEITEDKSLSKSKIEQKVPKESTDVHVEGGEKDFVSQEQLESKVADETNDEQSGSTEYIPSEDNEAVIDLDDSNQGHPDAKSMAKDSKEETLNIAEEEDKLAEVETTDLQVTSVKETVEIQMDTSKDMPAEQSLYVSEQKEEKPVDEAKTTQADEQKNFGEDENKISSEQVDSQNEKNQEMVSIEVTAQRAAKKPENMVIDLISSDEESLTQAASKECSDKASDIDKLESSTSNEIVNLVTVEKLVSETDTKAIVAENNLQSENSDHQEAIITENLPASSMEQAAKKVRVRKPSTFKESDTTPRNHDTMKASATLVQQDTFDMANNVQLEVHAEKPKATRRKSMYKDIEAETKTVKATTMVLEKGTTAEKSKRRARRFTTEVIPTDANVKEKVEQPIDLDKPRRRGRKHSPDLGNALKKSDEVLKTELEDLTKANRRGIKSTEEVKETADKDEEIIENPLRRTQAASADDITTEGRIEKKSDSEKQNVVEAKPSSKEKTKPTEASNKPMRRVRKPTTEPDDPKTAQDLEIVKNDETGSSREEKGKQADDLVKTMRRGRKPTTEVDDSKAQLIVDKPKEDETGSSTEEKGKQTNVVVKSMRRGRKANTEVDDTTAQLGVDKAKEDETRSSNEEKGKQANVVVKTMRRGRKANTEVDDTTAQLGVDKAKEDETGSSTEEKGKQRNDVVKSMRRVRKPSAEVVEAKFKLDFEKAKDGVETELMLEDKSNESDDVDKPKRQLRKPTTQTQTIAKEVQLDSGSEKKVDLEKPTRRLRKPTTDLVETEKKSEETTESKRRGRKPSADVAKTEEHTEETLEHGGEQVPADVPVDEPTPEKIKKSKRRYHKASAEVVEATEAVELPEKKQLTRNTRKASAETVESEMPTKEHMAIIVEAGEPDTKKLRLEEPTDLDTAPHAGKKRGRKQSASRENVQTEETLAEPQASGSREKSATRRGHKKAVEKESEEVPTAESVEAAEPKSKRRGRMASADVVAHSENQSSEPAEKATRRGRKPSADVEHKTEGEDETSADKKTTRRLRKPSTAVEETTQPKKTMARRGRKASLSAPAEETDKEFDVQSLPTLTVDSATVISAMISPKPQVHSSEDELTPRRREGRNLPRKNYDETSDEDKPSSSRKARKLLATKPATAEATTPKPVETETLPPSKPTTPSVELAAEEPAVAPHTPVVNIVLPEPTSSQKREGRNMPRKNYSETSDDEKPSTSRGRRVRQPTIKALELLVDAAQRPVTPKRKAGKGKATETVDAHVEEPPEKKIALEDSTPVTAKARGAASRRKAAPEVVEVVTEAESVTTPAVKRGGRSRKESASSQHEEVSSVEAEQKQPVKRNARGANARKTKITVDEVTDEQPVNKKPRGGARAKTPVVVEAAPKVPEVEEPKEVPAGNKRGRQARGAKVADEADAVHETAAAVAAPPSSSSRSGRGRKVHFETTEEVMTAAKDKEQQQQQPGAAEAPKRATRSRRK